MFDHFSDCPVLLWQMGKVGSTSIGEALRNIGLDPIQLHVLDQERIDSIVREHTNKGFSIPGHIKDAVRIKDLIENTNNRFRIISLMRDPVARNLSALFESWEIYPPSYNHIEGPAALAEWFVMNFDYSVLNWFDREIYHRTGINVYDQSFDHKEKRLTIQTERFKILVLRKEDNQFQKQKNIEDFLGVKDINIELKNVSKAKDSGKLWSIMNSSAKISLILSGIVYNSQVVKHFYTKKEIDLLKSSWMPSRDGLYFEPRRA